MERNGGFWIETRVLPSKRGARDIELACDVSADQALEGRRGTVVSGSNTKCPLGVLEWS